MDEKKIVQTFFITLLIIGLITASDYGLSYDEQPQRELGEYYYNYVFKGDQQLFSEMIKIYGPAFELPLIVIEKSFGLTDEKNIFLMRHLMTFLLFYVSVIFFYKLLKDYHNWQWALIGCLILLLSPRIFANSFYNSKDLAFLSFFIISMYTLNNLLKNFDYQSAIIHGLTTGLLIDVRVIGVVMPFITLIILLIKKQKWDLITAYLLASVLLTIMFWPTLWQGPIKYFFQSISEMSQFSHWDNEVFYLGSNYSIVPWHYIPVWVWLTTPVLFTTLFFIGLFYIKQRDLIQLGFIALPVISTIILRSTIYNGWRHFYFIYPSMVLIMINGLKSIKVDYKIKYLLLGSYFVFTLFSMINLHPYEGLYFNELTNMQWVKANLPIDYWGLTIREGLQWIADHDTRPDIKVYSYGMDSIKLLDNADRDRISFSLFNVKGNNWTLDTDYIINNYDHVQSDYEQGEECYTKMIRGVSVMQVRRVRETLTLTK